MRLSVHDLTQGYNGNVILDGISFDIDTNEVLALLGPNGSGKSTLIKTICNFIPPMSGDVTLDGVRVKDIDMTDLAKMISYVPQSVTTGVYTTVMDTVLLGRKPYVTWSYRQKDIDYAVEAMRNMRVLNYSSKNVSDLSGGQRQRVLLARSLAQCPSFFIFDEPTSALDMKHQMNTMLKMNEIVHEKGAGMIIALHDINLAMNYSDKVLMLKNGKKFAFGIPKNTITEENVRRVYGVESRIVETENRRYVLPISPNNTEEDD